MMSLKPSTIPSALIPPLAGVRLQVLKLNLPLSPLDRSPTNLFIFIQLFPAVLCPFSGEGLTSPEMVEYLQQIPSLIYKSDDWGYVSIEQKEPLEKFVEQLIGRYMGTSPKKGYSYTWIPNHLQDANGNLFPRFFLKYYSCAATFMLAAQNQKALQQLQVDALLTPSAIQDSIQEVSTDRVQELQEDYPWLEKFKTIVEGSTLLMQEKEFLSKIQRLLEYYPNENYPAKTPSSMEDE